ncbi:class II glutamine amidotransferase, partial [Curvivirga aplysinae]|uniref:class II glutamine amidotransferase n=1 Tax=Curvivirga aplysinae TaxID=2529852 RepID=UPI0012BB9D74
LSYRGPSIFLEEMLYAPSHSLIEQSLHAFEAKTPTNGDGFGIGWYGERSIPGTYHEILPAWNDSNLRNIAAQVRSGNFFAHVRASTGTATSRQNCHPFSYNKWMFMHNGQIGDYCDLRRKLESDISDELYAERTGTTDSELLFLLMLDRGLDDNPIQATKDLLEHLNQVMSEKSSKKPFRMTAAFTDGPRYYAMRYSTDDKPPSLYYAQINDQLIIMSEPSEDDSTTWIEVPPSTLIEATADNQLVFHDL